jgi:hypothetical protein
LTLSVKRIVSRFIQIGNRIYTYDIEGRRDNVITIGRSGSTVPGWYVPTRLFNGLDSAAALSSRTPSGLVTTTTLGGHPVYMLQMSGVGHRALRLSLYFDRSSYLLRGFDASGVDPAYPTATWRARLTTVASVSRSGASTAAFTLDAPQGARVALPPMDAPSYEMAFRVFCHSKVTLKAAVGSGLSPLEVCRRTNPSVTTERLVGRLVAVPASDLRAALRSGQISRAQEHEALKDLRSELVLAVRSGGLQQGQPQKK